MMKPILSFLHGVSVFVSLISRYGRFGVDIPITHSWRLYESIGAVFFACLFLTFSSYALDESDRAELRSALLKIERAQSNLNNASNIVQSLMNSSSSVGVYCEYYTTGSWKGKFIGDGRTENIARASLRKDCMKKYPGPRDIVCRDLEGAVAVKCERY